MTRAEAAISLLARIVASPPEGGRKQNDPMKVRMLITMASTAPKGYIGGTPRERAGLAALVRQGKCHTRTFGEQTHHFLTDAGRAYVNAILR